ncbi:hypothetical protein Vretimale_2814 [Volvox reticuliferus]|uniref:SET domain-containing protein n=1 Tax=Volvox reticuliferus TaxID=1737510 RepID=A0A8J4DDD1_9CHLO|nr:hypothetical protein Vretifemale_6830 [Volvox reticuliferus]GIL97344.1 hypothetical protein Vretimale_2814 [Volvox reticuliferus]
MHSTQRMAGHPAIPWETCCHGNKPVFASQHGGRTRKAVLASAVFHSPRPISGDRAPVLGRPAMALQMPRVASLRRHKPRSYPCQIATAAAAPGFGDSLNPRLGSGTAPYHSNTSPNSTSGGPDGCTADVSTSSHGNNNTFNSAGGYNRINNNTGRRGSLAPLRLVDIPGKGRGVVATRKLSPGELLLVCGPLALVQGPAQTMVQVPQQQSAKVGARRTQQRPTSVANAGAIGPDGVTSWVPKAAASISEAALVSELQRLEWSPRQAQILAFLYRGVQEPVSTGRPTPRRGVPATAAAEAEAADNAGGVVLDLTDLTDPWDGGDPFAIATTPSAAVSTRQAVTGTSLTHRSGLMAEQLAAVVRLNATGLPSDDVLLAKLYGRPNHSFIGLWPAHAMLNHSCAPNAVAVVSGSELFIRCCAPVPAGGEVCITYSGALGLGPLPLRRALLERNHRFRCMCPRCMAEERVPRELAQLWSDIMMLASQQLQPQLVAAAAALRVSSRNGNGSSKSGNAGGPSSATSGQTTTAASATAAAAVLPSLLDVRGQVAKCFGLFEETLGQLSLSPQEALWLQASMYPLYETRARCAQLITTAVSGATSVSGVSEETRSPEQHQTHVQQLELADPGELPPQQQVQVQQQEQQQEDINELERRLSEEYLDALSLCLRLQGAANAGSDMHVQLAARYDAACAAHVARHPGPRARQLAMDARQRLERALGTRYGIEGGSQFEGTSGGVRTEGFDTSDPPMAEEAEALKAPLTAPSLEELVAVLDELRRQQLQP